MSQVEPDDTVITEAVLWAGNPPVPQTGWLALKDGRIRAVGTAANPPPQARQVIPGKGKVVLPSFVDCHSHLSAAALANISRNGSAYRNKGELLAAVAEAARRDTSSEWILFFYVDWDTWDDPRPASAQELEMAAPGRNVFVVCGTLHRGILSETALRTCNITPNRFVETTRGKPNGVVWEESFSACLQTAMKATIRGLGDTGFKDAILAEAERHLAYGVTDAHDPAMNPTLYPIMQAVNKESPLRISWSEVGKKGPISSAEADTGGLADYGAGPKSAKVFTDGAHRCAMCIDAGTALTMSLKTFADAFKGLNLSPVRQLLADEVGFSNGKIYRKGALFDPPDLTRHLESLAGSHDRIKVHALGNHAVDMTCDCVEEAGLTTKVCLEHATLIDDSNLEKLSKYNIQVSLQPGFIPHYGVTFLKAHLGEKYRGLAARSMLDAGVELIMSSDNPCGPLDPLYNIRCAVNRQLSDGRTYLEAEAVNPEEAVYAYTVKGMAGITGSDKQGLAAGAPADLVILTGDPFSAGTVVESTWIGGKAVYQA